MESGRGISFVNQSTNPGLGAERHREVTLVTDLIGCSDRFGRHFCDSLSPYQPSPRFAARLNAALLLPPKTIGIGVFGRGENNASEKLMCWPWYSGRSLSNSARIAWMYSSANWPRPSKSARKNEYSSAM